MKNPDLQRQLDKPITLLVASTNGLVSIVIFAILPLLVGVASDQYQLNDTQAGLLASTYFSGYAIVALTAVLWIRKCQWRWVSRLGLLLMGTALVATLVVDSFGLFRALLLIAGFGAAIIFPISMTLVSDMSRKERAFAIKMVPEQLIPAIILILATTLWADLLTTQQLLSMVLVIVIFALLISSWMPKEGLTTKSAQFIARSNKGGKIGLLALMVFFAGFCGVWAFCERIGNENDQSRAIIGQLLALGLITSGIGPLLASWIENKYAIGKPLCIGTAISILSLVLLAGEVSASEFMIVMLIMPFFYYFALSYVFAVIAYGDTKGQLSSLMPFVLAVAAAIGPGICGIVRENHSNELALILMGIFIFAGAGLSLYGNRVNSKLLATT